MNSPEASSSIVNLNAKPRSATGKSGARTLRRDGQLPAVTYGRGEDPVALSVSPADVAAILHGPRGRNAVIELKVEGGKSWTVMIGDYEVHPVKRSLVHVDFVRVGLDQTVECSVPLKVTGKSQGVTIGGELRQVFRELPIACVPDKIPAVVVVDITDVGLGETIAAKDLPLPEGVAVRLAPERTVVAVVAPRRDKSQQAEEGAAEAGAAPAEGAAEPAKA